MNRWIQARLVDLQARQKAGKHMSCPRCGLDTMKPEVNTNALSRLADIMICDDCGMVEAKLAFMRNVGTLYSWAAFQPNCPASDFKARKGADVRREVEGTKVPIPRLPEPMHKGRVLRGAPQGLQP